MIVQDVVDWVQRQFGDEASVQINTTDIMRWINAGAKEIAVQNDNNEFTSTRNSVVGQGQYTFPNGDVLAVRSMFYDNQKLQFMSRQEYDAYIIANDPDETATGTPWLYTRWVDDFVLYPKPDSIQVIKIWYFRRPFAVADVNDSLPFDDEYHLRIVEYCLQQAYQTDEDWEAATQMQGQFSDGLTRLKQMETAKDAEFYPSITVLPDDSGY